MANRAFIRFRNITIPNYSEVSNVFVRFTAYSNKSDTPVDLRCAFVNADNPGAPSTYAQLQALSLTDWVSWSSLEGWTDGNTYDTPDLTDILQTIIDREGWAQDNSIVLIIEDVSSSGQRGFSSIQHAQGVERSVLFVTYIAREVLFVVNDDFIGEDEEYPSNSRWGTNSYNAKPYIDDNRLYLGIFSEYNEGVDIFSNWYVVGAIEANIDVDIDASIVEDVYSNIFSFSIQTVRQSSVAPSASNYAQMVRFQFVYYSNTDEWKLEAVLGKYGENAYIVKQEVYPSGILSCNLRISVDQNGYSRFYVDGELWESSTFDSPEWEPDEYSSWRSERVYTRMTGDTSFYNYVTGTIYVDNFVLNSGAVMGPLGFTY